MTAPKAELNNDDEQTTATGLARYAFEYIEAAMLADAEAAEKMPGNMISPTPAYFLALHGIELTLKAYLRQKRDHGKRTRKNLRARYSCMQS